jgi:hypothetical protein
MRLLNRPYGTQQQSQVKVDQVDIRNRNNDLPRHGHPLVEDSVQYVAEGEMLLVAKLLPPSNPPARASQKVGRKAALSGAAKIA